MKGPTLELLCNSFNGPRTKKYGDPCSNTTHHQHG